MIIGTSTSRLLRPTVLNPLFGGSFTNLAMNSATAYEQYRLLQVFTRHHPEAGTVLIGVDVVWCEAGGSYQKYTPRPFPEWMYDDNPWNDYAEHFNPYAIEQAGLQFGELTGLRPHRYGRDGYTSFVPDNSAYDLEKVRRSLYPDGKRDLSPITPPQTMSGDERAKLVFPTHGMLHESFAALPEATRKIVFFPLPYFESATPRQPGKNRLG